MAAQEDPGTGSKDRATVAVVSEKVTGLTDLVRASFENVQRQLDVLQNLPSRMSVMEERQMGLHARMDAAEKREHDRERDGATFRKVHLPTLLVSVFAFLAAVAASVAAFLH